MSDEIGETDPPRLAEMASTDSSLRALLGQMQSDVPSAAEVDALAMRTKHARRANLRTKGTLAGGAVLVLLGASLFASRPHPTPTPVVAAANPQRVALAPAPPQEEAPPPSALVVEAAADQAAEAPRTQPPRPRIARPVVAQRPVDEPAVAAQAPAVEAAVLDEVALLAAARRALRSNPTHALALVHEHAERFPSSAFAEERAVLRIDGLVATGAVETARSERTRFAQRWPQSVHQRHLDELLSR
jgi:hypothetical protein